MKYIRETDKSVDQARVDLEAAVVENGFGVLHVHNLRETMRKKGVEFNEDCMILEVCNPHKAKQVLESDMSMNMALPCRLSVYSENGKTYIGMIKPSEMLGMLSQEEGLREVAAEVEALSIRMIDAAV